MIITSGTYEGHGATVEANVYQSAMDYPDEWSTGYHVMLDHGEGTVRWDQVVPCHITSAELL